LPDTPFVRQNRKKGAWLGGAAPKNPQKYIKNIKKFSWIKVLIQKTAFGLQFNPLWLNFLIQKNDVKMQ
jgi:hypothetical protein